MTNPVGRRQRFVEDRKRAIDMTRPGFRSSMSNLDEPVVGQNVGFAQKFGAAAHVLEPAGRAAFSLRQAL